MNEAQHQYSSREKRSTKQLVALIQSTDQDFEWYPTTDAILQAIKTDLDGPDMVFDNHESPSVLDCGAGDGRSLVALTNGARYAIEKSRPLLQQMDRSIFIVGTEFREQTLIDKKVDVIFCNPPYKEYEDWMVKIVREGNAKFAYFVVPTRWRENSLIEAALNSRDAKCTAIGSFDFQNAERKARARVDILRVDLGSKGYYGRMKVDPFNVWFDEYFHLEINNSESGKHDWETSTSAKLAETVRRELVAGSDLVGVLERLYQADLAGLMANYKALEEIDPALLRELDVNLQGVKGALQQKIEGLKDRYWKELFDNFGKITSRLTHASREVMLKRLTAHTHVDFTASNAHAILIWVVKNSNIYLDDQLVDLVETIVEKANISLYKSNQRTFGLEEWRYGTRPESLNRFGLDYRVVMHRVGGINCSPYDFERNKWFGLSERAFQFLGDVLTIANNLGFDTSKTERVEARVWESNKANEFRFFDHAEQVWVDLMKVRAFKNGNLHIHFNQAFICRLNVEFGRLKGWLKDHVQAADELDIDPELAMEAFGKNLQLPTSNVLRLCSNGRG